MLHLVCVSRRKQKAFSDLYAGDLVDPDQSPERFRDGIDTWVIQTYLRLSGVAPWLRVSLSTRVQPGAINLLHRDEARWYWDSARAFTVVVRADRPPIHAADRVVVQTPLLAGNGRIHLPFWPQPGLLPRDPARGDRFETVAYMGRPEHLPSELKSAAFARALEGLGLRLDLRNSGWHDYREVDAVLALRTDPPAMVSTKPASKLSNAWLAGVPALLGPEPAYRLLGRRGRDYLEVADAAAVLEALRQLAFDLDRRRALVTAGCARRSQVDLEAVRQVWLKAIVGPLHPISGEGRPDPGRWLDLASRALRQRLQTARWRSAPTPSPSVSASLDSRPSKLSGLAADKLGPVDVSDLEPEASVRAAISA